MDAAHEDRGGADRRRNRADDRLDHFLLGVRSARGRTPYVSSCQDGQQAWRQPALEEAMPQSVHPLIEARRDQMFPVLEPEDIERLSRFGERRSYAAGERMVATGEIAPGAFVILRGRVDVMQRGTEGHPELIVTHGPGSFMGELAQLSDRPSLVDADGTEA